jgi:hypothetical protein
MPAKELQVDLASSDTTIIIDSITDWNGDAITTSFVPGDYIPATLINDAKTQVEFILIDATTIANAATTGATIFKRGLELYGTGVTATDQTEVAAHKLDWNANETKVLLGTNPPYMYGTFANRFNAETIDAIWTFNELPTLDAYEAPTDDKQFAPKKYVDDIFSGGTVSINRIVVAGTAGETVAAGNLVYFDFTDNEWKLCDADTAGTVEQVLLGIAQGAGTNGNTISGGVLLKGLDSNQNGLTPADQLFASNTAGGVANSAGTTERSIGIALTASTIYFDPYFFHTIKEADKDLLEAITSTAVEINKLDGYTGTTADLNEMSGIVQATDITGAQLETLSDGSNADGEHVHGYCELLGTMNDVDNDSTNETTLFTATVPANTLGTANAIRGRFLIAGRHQNGNWVIKLKYGSTTLITLTNTNTWSSRETGWLDFILTADGATGAQNASMAYFLTNDSGAATPLHHDAGEGTATEDSTGALTLEVTIQVTSTTNTELLGHNGSVVIERT